MLETRPRLPVLLLLLATLLFALGPAVLKLLTERGAEIGLRDRHAISFCNVLFVGNLCAGLVTLVFSGPVPIGRELRGLSWRVRLLLLAAALVSTIYPALLFIALEKTTVINIVLLSRFNGIVWVALAYLLFRETVRRSEAMGYAVIATGVVVLLAVNNQGLRVREGDAYVLLAAVFFALTELISRKTLPHVTVPTYVFFRNFVSAVIFFWVASAMYGFRHFMDAFASELWILMAVYAVFAIVTAQLLWLHAVRVLPVKVVANVQLLNPAFSIAFAFLLLGEVPTAVQWLVILIIAVGMLVPRFWHRYPHVRPMQPLTIDTSLVAK